MRRVADQSELAQEDLSRLKFLDEAGSHLALTRPYGRGKKGQRVVEAVPKDDGENLSLLASLSVTGIEAPMTINGAVDSIVFKVYVEEV